MEQHWEALNKNHMSFLFVGQLEIDQINSVRETRWRPVEGLSAMFSVTSKQDGDSEMLEWVRVLAAQR